MIERQCFYRECVRTVRLLAAKMIILNDLLSLEADIFGSLDEPREISFGLDVLAFEVWVGNAPS